MNSVDTSLSLSLHCALLLGGVIAGCHPGDTGDSGGAAPAACEQANATATPRIHSVESKYSKLVPIVPVVLWSMSSPAKSEVELELNEGLVVSIPGELDPDKKYFAALRGLGQAETARYRITTEQDGSTFCTPWATVTTGSFGQDAPTITVEISDPARASTDYLFTSLFTEASSMGSAIIDADGRLLWWLPGTYSMATRMGDSVDHVAFQRQSSSPDAPADVIVIDHAARLDSAVTVTGAHVDFQHVGEACWGCYAWEVRSFDDGARLIAGDNLVEACPNGEVREIWSPWDWLEPDLDHAYTAGTISSDPSIEAWTHANSLDFDPDQQVYYYLASDIEQLYKIDRASGALLWILDNDGGDFTLQDDRKIIDFPHAVQAVEGGVLIYNRTLDDCSHAIEIALDEDAMTARVVWSHTAEECFETYWMGQAERLENGNTRIAWSTAGAMDEITPEGEVVRRWHLPMGGGFGFGESHASLYDNAAR